MFYTDVAAPNNVRTVNLVLNNIQAGDVVTVNLGNNFSLSTTPIVNGATVKVSGQNVTFTFTNAINTVSVPIQLKASFTNGQKSLATIQTAIASGKVPGNQTLTATETRKSDGSTYESTLTIDAELTPFSTPTGLTNFRTITGSYVQNRDYTFTASYSDSFASDGLLHPAFNSTPLTLVTLSNIPGGFVLTGGMGWTQSGTTLTYDGTGNGLFTGHFTGALGSYTIPINSVSSMGYFGYSTTPVTITNTATSSFSITSMTVAPTATYANPVTETHYQMDPTLSHGRTLADVPEASMNIVSNTGDPSVSTAGDRSYSNFHWEFSPQVPFNSTSQIMDSFTVPSNASAGAVVTFQDGSTKTYPSGTMVTFDNPEANPVTKIAMDFGSVAANTTITVPVTYHYLNGTIAVNADWQRLALSGTYSDGATFGNIHANNYGAGCDVYTGFISSTGMGSVNTNLQYGGKTTSVKPQAMNGSGTTSQLVSHQVYEPIIYAVLPLGVDYQGVSGGLSGYKVSTYTISTGQTVVKIDYTGSGQLVGVTTTDWPTINYIPKAYGVAQSSVMYSYISAKNDPVMTLTRGGVAAGTTIPDSSLANEITQGDSGAVLDGTNLVSISGTSYLTGATSITNNQGITSQAGVNDLVQGADHALNIDLVNTFTTDSGTVSTLTNLPDASDGLTLNLTGPGTLMDVVTNKPVTDSTVGQLLYSTSKGSLASDGSVSTSGYVPADQVTDWSAIQSIIVQVSNLNGNSEYSAHLPVTAPDALDQLNTPVTISTALVGQGMSSAPLTTTDEFTSSVKKDHATVAYDANTGDSDSLPANQNSDDFLEVPGASGSVTLSSVIPTKTSGTMIYSFIGWNTSADGSGTAYQPGDVLSNLTAESTTTLYAQWGVAVQKPSFGLTPTLDLHIGDTFSPFVLVSDPGSLGYGQTTVRAEIFDPQGNSMSTTVATGQSSYKVLGLGTYKVVYSYPYTMPDGSLQTLTTTQLVRVTPELPELTTPSFSVIDAGDSLDLSATVTDPDKIGVNLNQVQIKVMKTTDAGDEDVTSSMVENGTLNTTAKDYGKYTVTYTYPYSYVMDGQVVTGVVSETDPLTVKIIQPSLAVDPIPPTTVGDAFDPQTETLTDPSGVVDGETVTITVYPPGTTFDDDGNPSNPPVTPNPDGTITPDIAGDYEVVYTYDYVDENGNEHSRTTQPALVTTAPLGYDVPSVAPVAPKHAITVYTPITLSDLVSVKDGHYDNTAQTPFPIDSTPDSAALLSQYPTDFPNGVPAALSNGVIVTITGPVMGSDGTITKGIIPVNADGTTVTPVLSGTYTMTAYYTYTTDSGITGTGSVSKTLNVGEDFGVSAAIPSLTAPTLPSVMEGSLDAAAIDVKTGLKVDDGNNTAGNNEDQGSVEVSVTDAKGNPVLLRPDGQTLVYPSAGTYTVTYLYHYFIVNSANELVEATQSTTTTLTVTPKAQLPTLTATDFKALQTGDSFNVTTGVTLTDPAHLGLNDNVVKTKVTAPDGTGVTPASDGTVKATQYGTYQVVYTYGYHDPLDNTDKTLTVEKDVQVTPHTPTLTPPDLPATITAGDSLDLSAQVSDPDQLGVHYPNATISVTKDGSTDSVTLGSGDVLATTEKDYGHYTITYSYDYVDGDGKTQSLTETRSVLVKIVTPSLTVPSIPPTTIGTPFDPSLDDDALDDPSGVVEDNGSGEKVTITVYPPGTTFDADGTPSNAAVTPNDDGTITPTEEGDYVVVYTYTYVDENGHEQSESSEPVLVTAHALSYDVPVLTTSSFEGIDVYDSFNPTAGESVTDGVYYDDPETPEDESGTIPGTVTTTVTDSKGQEVTPNADGTITPTTAGLYTIHYELSYALKDGSTKTSEATRTILVSPKVPSLTVPALSDVMDTTVVDVTAGVKVTDDNLVGGGDASGANQSASDYGSLTVSLKDAKGNSFSTTSGTLPAGTYTATYSYTYEVINGQNQEETKTVEHPVSFEVKATPTLKATDLPGINVGETLNVLKNATLTDPDGLGSGSVEVTVTDAQGAKVPVDASGSVTPTTSGTYQVTYTYAYREPSGTVKTLSQTVEMKVVTPPTLAADAIASVKEGASFNVKTGLHLSDLDGLGSGQVTITITAPDGKTVTSDDAGNVPTTEAGNYLVAYAYDYLDANGQTITLRVIRQVTVQPKDETGQPKATSHSSSSKTKQPQTAVAKATLPETGGDSGTGLVVNGGLLLGLSVLLRKWRKRED